MTFTEWLNRGRRWWKTRATRALEADRLVVIDSRDRAMAAGQIYGVHKDIDDGSGRVSLEVKPEEDAPILRRVVGRGTSRNPVTYVDMGSSKYHDDTLGRLLEAASQEAEAEFEVTKAVAPSVMGPGHPMRTHMPDEIMRLAYQGYDMNGIAMAKKIVVAYQRRTNELRRADGSPAVELEDLAAASAPAFNVLPDDVAEEIRQAILDPKVLA